MVSVVTQNSENSFRNVLMINLNHSKMFPVLVRQQNFVGFEGLTVVVMKSTVFWDITVCTLLSQKISTLEQNSDYRS
jgi:hypothetical protein